MYSVLILYIRLHQKIIPTNFYSQRENIKKRSNKGMQVVFLKLDHYHLLFLAKIFQIFNRFVWQVKHFYEQAKLPIAQFSLLIAHCSYALLVLLMFYFQVIFQYFPNPGLDFPSLFGLLEYHFGILNIQVFGIQYKLLQTSLYSVYNTSYFRHHCISGLPKKG